MELKDLRVQIDAIDSELIQLFIKRMALSEQVAVFKKEHDMPIHVPAREQEILDYICANVTSEMAPYTQELYRKIFELSRCYQSKRTL